MNNIECGAGSTMPANTVNQENLPVEITGAEFKVLIRGLSYLEPRDFTYHGKIAVRAFGGRNKIDDEGYDRLIANLDTLVDRGVLETEHRKYAFASDAYLANTDFGKIFTLTAQQENLAR